MRSIFLTCTAALLLAGCAETYLAEAESSVALSKISNNQTHLDVTTLDQASRKAAKLAYSYLKASHKVTTVQEASAGVALVAAGAAAHGLAVGASKVTLTNRALPGVAATIVAGRYANQKSIQAIYAGAQRLNCISSKAGIAHASGILTHNQAAVVATRAALLDAQIKTRSELVRGEPSFVSFLGQFKDGFAQLVEEQTKIEGVDTALNAYLGELAECVAIETKGGDSQEASGPNPDIPNQTETNVQNALNQG